jgi:hypothetical protein
MGVPAFKNMSHLALMKECYSYQIVTKHVTVAFLLGCRSQKMLSNIFYVTYKCKVMPTLLFLNRLICRCNDWLASFCLQ